MLKMVDFFKKILFFFPFIFVYVNFSSVNSQGKLQKSFGSNAPGVSIGRLGGGGVVIDPLIGANNGVTSNTLNCLALDHDNQSIFGSGYTSFDGDEPFNFALAKITVTDGKVLWSTLINPIFGTINAGSGQANALVVNNSGTIILAGYGKNDNDETRYLIAGCNSADGSLNISYGGNGTGINGIESSLLPGGTNDVITCSILDQKQNLLVAGDSEDGVGRVCSLARFDDKGILDTTFAINGYSILSIPGYLMNTAAIGLQFFGENKEKIIITGTLFPNGGHTQIFIVRFNFDGSLDTSFGANGEGYVIVPLLPTNDFNNSAFCLTVLADDSLVIGGGNDNYWIIVKLTPNGLLDTTFGPNGAGSCVASPAFGFSTNITGFIYSMYQDGNGCLLAAGKSHDNTFLLARILPNGSGVDNTFGINGLAEILPETGGTIYGGTPFWNSIFVGGTSDDRFTFLKFNNDVRSNFFAPGLFSPLGYFSPFVKINAQKLIAIQNESIKNTSVVSLDSLSGVVQNFMTLFFNAILQGQTAFDAYRLAVTKNAMIFGEKNCAILNSGIQSIALSGDIKEVLDYKYLDSEKYFSLKNNKEVYFSVLYVAFFMKAINQVSV